MTTTPSDLHDLEKPYDARAVEARWYSFWLTQGVMDAVDDAADTRPTYVIPMPPPNVTGSLHMGHALRCTLQDTLIRFFRMRGYNTLWQPGIDHAGIATQLVVERQLRAEGTSRLEMGRDAFVARVWKWKGESGGRIADQQRVLGSSAAWSRSKFTLDDDMSQAVRHAFVQLHNDGLMYRATRLINWCTECRTALSDLEVETQEGADGELFEFAYRLADGSGEIVVATTRPETILGDTAVAVHPDDPRYMHLHGKHVQHPFVARTIPIITDAELVDPEFGTGAVKITPAHDFNDFATGKRHGLAEINILNLDGTLNEHGGPFAGMDRFVARKAVKAALEKQELVRGSRQHKLNLPRCERSGGIVEPMISTQWFLKMSAMAKAALQAVEHGQTQIIPAEWQKTYAHFLDNIQDWCVSRQLWWGHQIPAWYGPDGAVRVAMERPPECGEGWHQDPDVLDTWFSSALWPFATLGWPQKTAALQKFYPASDLETGYDILFFWVARMMMFGLYFTGQAPFKRVLLSGLVVDETGEKMSKVKGNVIDPLDLIYGAQFDDVIAKMVQTGGGKPEDVRKRFNKAYPSIQAMGAGFPESGTDAVRWTLATYAPSNRRIALSPKRIQGNRFFINKLWNAARLTLELAGPQTYPAAGWQPKGFYNRWILSRLTHTLQTATNAIEAFRIDEAAQAMYAFVWNDYCDWFLEIAKIGVRDGVLGDAAEIQQTLIVAFETTLRLLHPIVPFVTEELWQRLPRPTGYKASIALSHYPTEADLLTDAAVEQVMQSVQGVISATRAIRSEHEIKPAQAISLSFIMTDAALQNTFKTHETLVGRLAKAQSIVYHSDASARERGTAVAMASTSLGMVQVCVSLQGIVTPDKEAERIHRELKRIEKDLAQLLRKLEAPNFTDRAPAEVVQEALTQRANLESSRTRLEEALGRVAELEA